MTRETQLTKVNRSIDRGNAAFAKLSASEKRVQIARDVLAQLALGRIRATNGQWLGASVVVGRRMGGIKITKDTQVNVLVGKLKRCDACALGGMFVCAVTKANALKVEDSADFLDVGAGEQVAIGDNAPEYLKRFFSDEQLESIESAFEKNDGAYVTDSGDEFAPEAVEPSDRMRLIMENIVVNKGRFVPSKQPRVQFVTVGFTA